MPNNFECNSGRSLYLSLDCRQVTSPPSRIWQQYGQPSQASLASMAKHRINCPAILHGKTKDKIRLMPVVGNGVRRRPGNEIDHPQFVDYRYRIQGNRRVSPTQDGQNIRISRQLSNIADSPRRKTSIIASQDLKWSPQYAALFINLRYGDRNPFFDTLSSLTLWLPKFRIHGNEKWLWRGSECSSIDRLSQKSCPKPTKYSSSFGDHRCVSAPSSWNQVFKTSGVIGRPNKYPWIKSQP